MKYAAAILGFAAIVSGQYYTNFTSTYRIIATPNQVVNSSNLPAIGQTGASGLYSYGINSRTNTICYNITLFGVNGTFQSQAGTGTHIHQAPKGIVGPPRIAIPDPIGNGSILMVSGCLTGPFVTGVKMADNITDTGANFNVAMIEASPSGFYTDSHTNLYPAGAIRGQLSQSYIIYSNLSNTASVMPPRSNFTGATNSNSVSGAMLAAGLLAALL